MAWAVRQYLWLLARGMQATCRDSAETELRESILQPPAPPTLDLLLILPIFQTQLETRRQESPLMQSLQFSLQEHKTGREGWRVDMKGQRLHHSFPQPISANNLMVIKTNNILFSSILFDAIILPNQKI